MDDTPKIEMRKIVPVVARTSAGKSNLLNILYNINFLECKPDITTKFINLLRYNPKIEQPSFFHLTLKKEKEKYCFYKDSKYEPITGEINIIEENKRINKVLADAQEINYEDIFYMTEIKESPFIKDEKYLLEHDLCDVPGLSEAKKVTQKKENINIDNDEISIKNDEKFKINEYIKSAIGYFKDFSLFPKKKINKEEIGIELDEISIQEEEKNTYLSEIFKILKDYIDAAIFILSQDNYFLNYNYELIAKFHKIINKPIKNFLIILNKIDLSDNPERDISNCKSFFLKYFPECKPFNLNLNTFVPLCSFRLKDELLLNKSFKHLLKYHLDNYIDRVKKDSQFSLDYSFILYLKNIMELAGKKEIEEINKINIADSIEKEIKEIIKKIKEIHKTEEIRYGFDSYSEEIDPMKILKDLYKYHSKNYLIPYPSENTYNLINYFKSDDTLSKKEKNEIKENETKILSIEKIIKNFNEINQKLEENNLISHGNHNIIKEKIMKIKEFEFNNNIFIPFLGPKNVGKSSIINGFIGEEILSSNTKMAFIISYIDAQNNEITISKSKLIKRTIDKQEKYGFDFKDDYIIAKGLEKVKETIKGLNHEFSGNNYQFSNKPEESFYHIRTKIKLFDDLGLDNRIKKNIYLFDFPGFENSTQLENFIYNKMMNIFNLFIFVFRNKLINDPNKKLYWNSIFNQSILVSGTIREGFIKSCLFILNYDEENEIKEINEIKNILDSDKKTNINILPFQAEYFKSYMKYYNYFFNIKDTVKNLFRENYYNTNNILKYPEVNKQSKIKFPSFQRYFIKNLRDITNKKELFQNEISENQEINKNIEGQICEAIKDIELPKYNIKVELNEKEKAILNKSFSFGQNQIHDSKLLKDSNYEVVKSCISDKIRDINNEIYSKYEKKINDICKIFELNFFDISQINQEKNEDYEKNKKNILIGFNSFMKKTTKDLEKLKDFTNKFKEALTKLKQEIINEEKGFDKKKSGEIKEDLYKLIKLELKYFYNDIENIFNYITSEQKKYFIKFDTLISTFTGSKDTNLEKSKDFKEHFISAVLKDNNNENYSNYDISEEISSEILIYINNGISRIFSKKGFFKSLISYFSKISFFTNIIEIILDYSNEKINTIIELLSQQFNSYMNERIELIKMRLDLLSLNHSKTLEDVKNKAKEIEKEYQPKKNENLQELQKLKKLISNNNK